MAQDSRLAESLGFIARRRSADALLQLEADLASGRKRAGTPLHEYRAKAEASLIEFIRLTWPVLEPKAPFVEGWALRAMAEHLEAVSKGQINNLLINCPPGCMKSLLTSVFWPMWEWGPRRRPDIRVISASYSDAIPSENNRKCRLLLRSDVYRQLWGDVFHLTQEKRGRIENDRTGFKEVTYVGGGTGARGDRVIVDDPLQISDAESEVKVAYANLWFTETATLRVTNARAAFVVIMQRLRDDDVSGLILDQMKDYVHLELPMRFDQDRPRKTTVIGFTDPRTQDGELLWPERFSKQYLEESVEPKLRAVGGEYAIASQLQQRPVPRAGGLFKKQDFVLVDAPPDGLITVRGWDLAASKGKTSAWTTGVKLGMTRGPKPRFFVLDSVRIRGLPHEVDDLLLKTARMDGHSCVQDIPQDPGQAGKSQVASFAALLTGFVFFFSPETGDKVTRAKPFASSVGGGNVSVVNGEWTTAFLNEICRFPSGTWRDQVDAASRAFSRLTLMRQGQQQEDVAPMVIS